MEQLKKSLQLILLPIFSEDTANRCVWLLLNLEVMHVPLKQLFKTELYSVPLLHQGTGPVTSVT